MKTHKINLPFTKKELEIVKSGDMLYLSGIVYTARDAAHNRMAQNMDNLPIELEGQVIYYVGPTPTFGNNPIGSAGPTTSARMDGFTPNLMKNGLVATIGKGDRDPAIIKACQEYSGLYLVTTGGVGALLSQCITSCQEIAYHDLGPESIKKLILKDFPVYVAYDLYGNDIFEK